MNKTLTTGQCHKRQKVQVEVTDDIVRGPSFKMPIYSTRMGIEMRLPRLLAENKMMTVPKWAVHIKKPDT
jgi:hypothetical protein